MNKFQKIALQIAKDDKNKKNVIFIDYTLKHYSRQVYLDFKSNRSRWTYLKALDFKNWNKNFKY